MARRIILRAETAELVRLNEWLGDRFAEGGLSAPVAADMKLCLNEAVTNTITHGFAANPSDALITVTLAIWPDRAEAVVEDNAIPFDPLAGETAGRIEDIETARIGGFGIKLIRDTATALRYDRVGDRNRLEIRCGGT